MNAQHQDRNPVLLEIREDPEPEASGYSGWVVLTIFGLFCIVVIIASVAGDKATRQTMPEFSLDGLFQESAPEATAPKKFTERLPQANRQQQTAASDFAASR